MERAAGRGNFLMPILLQAPQNWGRGGGGPQAAETSSCLSPSRRLKIGAAEGVLRFQFPKSHKLLIRILAKVTKKKVMTSTASSILSVGTYGTETPEGGNARTKDYGHVRTGTSDVFQL